MTHVSKFHLDRFGKKYSLIFLINGPKGKSSLKGAGRLSNPQIHEPNIFPELLILTHN